jgi:hypothetical protein
MMTETASMAYTMHNSHLLTSHFTPVRPAGQSSASTRIDTEGRRSRFHSPPPPPGASPSLLLPTPNHHVRTSTSPTMLSEDVFDSTFDSMDMSPLKPPVFEAEPDPGSQRSAASSQGTVVHLHKWYLKFSSKHLATLPIEERDGDITHWIIVGGTRVDRANAEDRRGKKESWRSSFVHKRTSATSFETASGATYELVGPCDFDQTSMRTTSDLAEKFKDGLPDNWVDVVAAEARRLGHVRLQSDSESDSFDPLPRKSMQGKKGTQKRKALSSPGSDIVPLSRRGSSISSSLPSRDTSVELPRKRSRKSQNVASQTSGTPKGIARELLQLQKSKLGNLSLVEAAINEGMNTPEQPAPQKVRKKTAPTGTKKSSKIKQDKKTEPIKEACPALTPLRSSGRAKKGMREWWKVSSQCKTDLKDEDSTQGKPIQVVDAQIEESPGTRLGQTTDVSDSEEEYKCASSSEGEEAESKEIVIKAAPKKYARKKSKALAKATSKEKDQPSIVDAFEMRKDLSSIVPPVHIVVEEKAEEEIVSIEEVSMEVQTDKNPPEETPYLEEALNEQGPVISPVRQTLEEDAEKEATRIEEEYMDEQIEIDLREKPVVEDDEIIPVPPEAAELEESLVLRNGDDNITLQKEETPIIGNIYDLPCKLLPDVLVLDDIDEPDDAEESLFYFSD